MGTIWGVDLCKTLIENVGFKQITVEEIPFYELNILYKAHKTSIEKEKKEGLGSSNLSNAATSAFRRLSMKLHY